MSFIAAKKDNERNQERIEEQKKLNQIGYEDSMRQIDDAWEDISLQFTQQSDKINLAKKNASEEFTQQKTQAERNASINRQMATDNFQVAAEGKYGESLDNTRQIQSIEKSGQLSKSSGLDKAGKSGTRLSGNTQSALDQQGELIDDEIGYAKEKTKRGLDLYANEASNYTNQADEALTREHQKIAAAELSYSNYIEDLDQSLKTMQETKDQKYKQLYGESIGNNTESGAGAGAQDLLTRKFNQGQSMLSNDLDFLRDNKWLDITVGAMQDLSFVINIAGMFV